MDKTPTTFLKIKIMGLAAESRIIKREETKWKRLGPPVRITHGADGKDFRSKEHYTVRNKFFPGTDHPLRLSLHEHRVCKVRPDIRAALLAYGFLRGRAYLRVENKTRNAPDWGKVWGNIRRHGVGGNKTSNERWSEDVSAVRQRFAEWLDASNLPKELKPYMGMGSAIG